MRLSSKKRIVLINLKIEEKDPDNILYLKNLLKRNSFNITLQYDIQAKQPTLMFSFYFNIWLNENISFFLSFFTCFTGFPVCVASFRDFVFGDAGMKYQIENLHIKKIHSLYFQINKIGVNFILNYTFLLWN